MKHRAMLLLLVCLFDSVSGSLSVSASEIVKIKLSDGETLTGKLALPADVAAIQRLIIFIHGTGPATYLDHRKFGATEFNYFDLFASEFIQRGAAFFTYNKRGVELGDTPPLYETVDREKFGKVLPSIEVKDIDSIIAFLKLDKRLKRSRVALLAWSEGTILAVLAAEKNKSVNALLLAGYVNDNLFDIIKWQHSGASSFVAIRKYFDANHDNIINKEEYESAEPAAVAMRKQGMKNAAFEQIDVNQDGKITAEDFGLLQRGSYNALLAAVEKKDDDWIWNNYFHVTSAWLKEHFELEPNKTRLLRINVPVFIFQGEDDNHTPVEGVYDIKERFTKGNKTNLQCFIFKSHDHDLNYLNWPKKKLISEGLQKIFEISAQY